MHFNWKISFFQLKCIIITYLEENACIGGERRSSEENTEYRYRDILNKASPRPKMAYVQSSKLQITQK